MHNKANDAFVAHFRAAYHRTPSIFAALSYDGVHILDAALHATGGKIEDGAAFRKAMETVKFDSVRGNFRFNTNHFPIQDLHLAEIKRDASGALANSYVERIVADHADSYADKCKMP
jgi:branched-chain amino acid transport system substrate-binding protein